MTEYILEISSAKLLKALEAMEEDIMWLVVLISLQIKRMTSSI